jgi:hypothetical protein
MAQSLKVPAFLERKSKLKPFGLITQLSGFARSLGKTKKHAEIT